MARLFGVNLPKQKRVEYGLTYLYGIGLDTSRKVLSSLGVSFDIRIKDLTESQVIALRDALSEYVLEGDLRRRVQQDVRRLVEVGSYRGIRHRRKLPVRGQRTHTNARTKRGKRIAVAGKKKAV